MQPFRLDMLVPVIEQALMLLARLVSVGYDSGDGCPCCLGTTLCGSCAASQSNCEECYGSGGCQNCNPFGPPRDRFPKGVIAIDDGAVQIRQEQRPGDGDAWYFIVEARIGQGQSYREVVATSSWLEAVQTALGQQLDPSIARLDPFPTRANLWPARAA